MPGLIDVSKHFDVDLEICARIESTKSLCTMAHTSFVTLRFEKS